MVGLPPNHCTQQAESLCDVQSFGAGTIFPGQAVWPRTGPQTNSPMRNVAYVLPEFGGVTDVAVVACDTAGGESTRCRLIESFYLVWIVCMCFFGHYWNTSC